MTHQILSPFKSFAAAFTNVELQDLQIISLLHLNIIAVTINNQNFRIFRALHLLHHQHWWHYHQRDWNINLHLFLHIIIFFNILIDRWPPGHHFLQFHRLHTNMNSTIGYTFFVNSFHMTFKVVSTWPFVPTDITLGNELLYDLGIKLQTYLRSNFNKFLNPTPSFLEIGSRALKTASNISTFLPARKTQRSSGGTLASWNQEPQHLDIKLRLAHKA